MPHWWDKDPHFRCYLFQPPRRAAAGRPSMAWSASFMQRTLKISHRLWVETHLPTTIWQKSIHVYTVILLRPDNYVDLTWFNQEEQGFNMISHDLTDQPVTKKGNFIQWLMAVGVGCSRWTTPRWLTVASGNIGNMIMVNNELNPWFPCHKPSLFKW